MTKTYVPGKYGAAGTHSHVCEVTYTIKDEGQPWERMVITSARPLCDGVRRGDKRAHSLQMKAELTTKTVTCEKCREFGIVKKEETA